jgi:hypothetical protein
MNRTVHPAQRNSSSTNGSERCPHCGADKGAWTVVCQLCWKSIPRPLRRAYFESTPFSHARQSALRTALRAIRRAGTNHIKKAA